MKIFAKIRDWFKNYWYYYKWTVLIAVFFVGVIIFCAVQSGDRSSYDASVLYTGPYIFEGGEKNSLSSAFSQVMSADYDGDGKKSVQIIDMTAFTDDQLREAIGTSDDPALAVKYAQFSSDNVKKSFSQQVFSGDASILIVDEYWYKIVLNAGGLVTLEEALGYRPESAVDDYSADFGKLEFSMFFEAAGNLPEGTRICFRRLPTSAAFTGRKAAEKNDENSKKLFCDIFAFEVPSA